MPSNSEVLDVIKEWSGKRPEKMSQKLEDWWNQTAPGSTHSTLKYDPDGIDDLLKRLKKKFPASPKLSRADFRAGGTIKTAQDLADALQPVVPPTNKGPVTKPLPYGRGSEEPSASASGRAKKKVAAGNKDA